MGHRLRRITCDWDFKNHWKVSICLNKCLKFLTNKKGEKIILKRSKKGYHLFLWTRTYGSKFKIREELGDDKKHLAMDWLHTYGRQTLFHSKTKLRNRRKKQINK